MKNKSGKSLYERLIVKFGLGKKKRKLPGIEQIYPDDVFICSYPKSGNTWLRIIVAKILYPNREIHLGNIDEFVHGLFSAQDRINSKFENRIIKSHYPYFESYPKTIYIYRDYRDVLISYYHYKKSLGEFSGDLSEFIRDNEQLEIPYGGWAKHLSIARQQKESNPNSILLIKYEDLHLHPKECIKEIASFLGLPQPKRLDDIISESSFNHLKNLETSLGSEFKKRTQKHFFRKGITNDWKSEFSKEDIDWLQEQHEIMSVLLDSGYAI